MSCKKSESKPCAQCPFARATKKEYLDTMGQNGERFAGQALGPFSLPCHMTREFKDWRIDHDGQTNCVGAAIYRSNAGYTHLPAIIPLLPKDHEAIFSSPEELLAHHKGTSVAEEKANLKKKPVLEMLVEELNKSGTQIRLVPKN